MTPEDELRSAEVALRVRPDYLIGGTQVDRVQELIAGSGMKYFPYVGRIVDHPCLLRGTVEEICEDARTVEAKGADGINLLAYRYDGDVPALVAAVSETTDLPLICAGSVDSTSRISELAGLDVWAFTVGTAALDARFVPGAGLEATARRHPGRRRLTADRPLRHTRPMDFVRQRPSPAHEGGRRPCASGNVVGASMLPRDGGAR